MNRKWIALLLSVALLIAVLSPLTGTIAEEMDTVAVQAGEVVPAAEPVVEEAPADEPAPAATAAPVEEIVIEPTLEPAEEATMEPTAELTAEITPEPAVELTAEPTAELTIEITVEPTLAPVVEIEALELVLYADQRSVFVDDNVSASGNVSGGTAPYSVYMAAAGEGSVVQEETITLDAAGTFTFDVPAMQYGDIVLTVAVTDAAGLTANAHVVIPVAVKETESRSQWEKAFEDFRAGGIWAEDLLAIARSQLGYEESSRNFIVAPDGQRKGYTRYGDWYGKPYGDWDAMFVAFCLRYAGISTDDYPVDDSCQDWKEKLIRRDAYAVPQDYVPKNGDLVFFNRDASGDVEHMGIVERVGGSSMVVIEGSRASGVQRNEYRLDDAAVDGYANTALLMQAAVQPETGAEVTVEPTAEPTVEPTAEPVVEPTVEPEMTPEPVVVAAYTNTEYVNIRAEATVESERLFQLAAVGEEVTVLSSCEANGETWYEVNYGEIHGYIRSDLLVLPEEELPVPEETPCACADEAGSRICAEDCACACHESAEEIPEEMQCACADEAGSRICAEDCACACHESAEEIPEEMQCACADEAGSRICAEDCACACHEPAEEIPEEIPALQYVQWQPGCTEIGLHYAVDGALGYVWQRGMLDANGEMIWEDLADAVTADLLLEANLQTLQYAYRCIATIEGGEAVASEAVTLVRADLAEWIAAGGVTEEMLARAVNAHSLDSLVVEGDILVHVRTGKAYAKIDAETGNMIDIETGLVVAVVDFETGMVYPVSAEVAVLAENEEA